jgi:CRISPR-associated protein Csm3
MVKGSGNMSQTPTSCLRVLKGYLKIYLKIINETGLLIRMPVQAQAFRIGGADQYPMVSIRKYNIGFLEVPYIPGSSLKGRMRSLLELALGKKFYTADEKIWQHVRSITFMKSAPEDFKEDVLNRCPVDDLFGWAAANYDQIRKLFEQTVGERGMATNTANQIFSQLAITRLYFDDFYPTEETIKRLNARSIADFLEEKSENRIDRITAAADPRTIPRVKPGVEFEGITTMLFFDIDKDHVKRYLETLIYGFQLVEDTYLGGCGSRGYGRVKFRDFKLDLYKITSSGFNLNIEGPKNLGIFKELGELKAKISDIADEIAHQLYG